MHLAGLFHYIFTNLPMNHASSETLHQNHQSNLRSPPQIINRSIILLNYGLSIRKIADIMRVSPTTIQRWKKRHLENNIQYS